MSGAATAAALVKYWCLRHEAGHDSSPEASVLADCMPLTHVMNEQGLQHVAETIVLEPVPGKPLFLFAGPGRRKPRGRTAAVAVFRAGFESSAVVVSCAASQYDSGGWRRAHMTKLEAQAAQANLTMNDETFRRYLEAFLSCAFEVPFEYLSESPGPDLDTARGRGSPWVSALAKALALRTDSGCWTVEVRLEVAETGIDLERCKELEALAVFGAEHEPSFTEIEEWLGESGPSSWRLRRTARPRRASATAIVSRTRTRRPSTGAPIESAGWHSREAWTDDANHSSSVR